MSDVPSDTSVGDDGISKHTPGGSGELSLRQAANSLTDWQNKQRAAERQPEKEPVSQPERALEAPAADESAPAADANPDEGHGETPEPEAPEAEPIDPPVSWTTAEKERWQSIPRETQEYIAQRETEREKLLTQKSKDAEDQLKGLTAREQAMEQARLQYEQLSQAALQGLQQQLQGEFSDIQSMDDVKRLANEDWARYLRWDAHQKDIAAKMSAVRDAQQRQAQDEQGKFAKFADEQDKHFITRVPEFADKEKAAKLQSAAIETLKRVGFSEDELTKYWNGQEKFSFRDARQQELIHKAARWDEAQAAKKVVSSKPLPPVQRPGVAQQSNSADQQIKALTRDINNAKGNEQLRLLAQRQALIQRANSRSQ